VRVGVSECVCVVCVRVCVSVCVSLSVAEGNNNTATTMNRQNRPDRQRTQNATLGRVRATIV